jgi:cytochrome oxidase assembly protein ShyY1
MSPMSAIEHLAGIVALILFAWSTVLLWATWQLQRLAKELDAERQAVRRWKRLHTLAQRQNVQWQ